MNGDTRTAYISLGSNMGQSALLVQQALARVAQLPGVRVCAVSRRYSTQPQSDEEQPWFINQAAQLECAAHITPHALLEGLLAIETAMGRMRDASRRFGPRIMDIDLLLFGNERLQEEALILPHPRMAQRAFVLVPLLEIAPTLAMPDGQSLADALRALPHRVEGGRIYQDQDAAG